MAKGRIGISFDGFVSVQDSLEIARQSVAVGARSLWMAEHLGYRDPMTSCMAFLANFPGVRVVPTAVSPYLHHPMPVAMALATMAEASPGHVAVAIGAGNPMFLAESGREIDKPLRAMREFVEMLRTLWAGAPVETSGLLHTLKGARLMFQPPEPVPIYIAAMKEQMLRLTGRIADGVVLSAGLSSEFVAQSLRWVDEDRAKSGRTESFAKAGYVYFLASDSPKGGYATLRTKLAFLMRNRYIDDSLAHSGLPIDQAAIMAAVSRRDFDAAARLVPEEAVEAFTITGTTRQCCDGIERFLRAGLDEVVLLMAGGPAEAALGYRVMREFA